MSRRRSFLAPFLVVAVVLGGCRSTVGPDPGVTAPTAAEAGGPTATPAARTERAGGSLRFGLSNDPRSIDPRFVVDDEGTVVVDALFDSLVAWGTDLEVVPAAAISWEIDDEGRRFTFELREDAVFHDGTPVTAEDFRRAFDRIANGQVVPASTLAYYLEPVVGFRQSQTNGAPLRGVRVLDDHSLEIVLQEPFPEFLEVLARPEFAPVPLIADEDPDGFAEAPVGNGPFAMAEPWQRNQFIRVQRAADYSGRGSLLDEVVFRIYANDAAQEIQYAEFASGQLQFAQVPASKRVEAIEQFGLSSDGYTGPGVLDGLSTTIYYYGFNLEQPPFDDPELRRAISLSIDRAGIAEDILRDTRVPADAIVPPSVPGAQRAPCDHCRYDPEEAGAIVAAAREAEAEADGDADVDADADADAELDTITLLHDSGTTHAAVAERVATDVERATGLQVDVRARPLSALVGSLRAGEMELFRLGWQADHPSPGAYLVPLFSSDRRGIDNLVRYADEEVDGLLREARSALDETDRRRLYHEAEDRILADVAVAPILFYRLDRVVAPGVRDLVMTPMGTVDLARVWLAGP